MSRMLRPLDDDNEIYPIPDDNDVRELGLDPKCHHGYTEWSCCPACMQCMVAHLWTAIIEMRVRKRRPRVKKKNQTQRG
jgi:hypothetical protein